MGSVLIPITGLPLLRTLLEPIRNVPSPPVVTTMSAHLDVRLNYFDLRRMKQGRVCDRKKLPDNLIVVFTTFHCTGLHSSGLKLPGNLQLQGLVDVVMVTNGGECCIAL